jgi:glycosyltransferase involved in cell wall biosynthesis
VPPATRLNAISAEFTVRIVIAHNRYHLPGGEDVVFEQERALLQRHGHEVFSYERSNQELQQPGLLPKIIGAAESVWSRATYADFSHLLSRIAPDVVHVHNTFLRISPSIFEACKDAGVPVVHTLHNYRLLCPATNLYRNGAPCEKCSKGHPWPGIARGCYRSSRLATGLSASVTAYNRLRRTWEQAVNRYIAPTQFLKSRLIAAGLPPDRVTVKPHFVDSDPGVSGLRGDYAVFLGRLSPEKGLQTLMASWERLADIPLRIIGDGPERSTLESISRQKSLNVQFVGHLPRREALEILGNARCLIFPSVAYESFGMGIIEAFACGVPVVASRHGAMQELIEHGRTGLLFEPADTDGLVGAVRALCSDDNLRSYTSRNARLEYECRFTAAANYQELMKIYESVLPLRQVPEAMPAAA